MAQIFRKSSFNELSRFALSSHFAGGVITSLLFINEGVAPGRSRSEVTSVDSAENGEIALIVALCKLLNDAHGPLGT